MPRRNFGLSVFRRGARPNAGVSWRPAHGVGLAVLAALLISGHPHLLVGCSDLVNGTMSAISWED